MSVDLFTLEVIKSGLVALGEEMFEALRRSSMSPIIYEALDYGIGITDAEGRLISQGNGIPGFVGTLDGAVQEVLKKFGADRIHPGDIFMTNTPYIGGGTHLSDVAMVMPVFCDGVLMAFAANKAHWTEVGGAYAGSFSSGATEVYQEGLQFPVIKISERGHIVQSVVDMIEANVRLPDMTLGDMWSGIAALKMGGKRFQELVARYGATVVNEAIAYLLDHGEKMVRDRFRSLPKGVFVAEDVIDHDGQGNGPFPVKVKITITESEFIADFTGSAPMAPGSINCTRCALESSAREVFMGVVDPGVSATEGCFRPLRVICPEGTVFTATRPAPVSNYFEAMVGAADLMRKALVNAVPDKLIAGQFGSICAFTLNGTAPTTGEPFILVQPLVGGWGAGANKAGESAQFCVGNGETSNIPVEIQESRYGVRVERYSLSDDPSGRGRFSGGRGAVIEYRILGEDTCLSMHLGRSDTPPAGVNGGEQGSCNYAEIVSNGKVSERFSTAVSRPLQKGDLVRVVTGNGGGWGAVESDSSGQAVTPPLDGGCLELQEI
ncbi:hydantoinase B/oxoprolinase family protein [Microbulbifer sp. CAU 1566]|uniref:hydantoinase B/oxoprolinase family protein n=1 Tax=Microbulbifer sp. CAU 1566 TaxID=2933269 RepID=UPI002004DEAD|nr:hydantoinase B/oxoprolinase family protein [Microbulbifer sp. CAU 1566]MCK7597671.1 hydantoinase B/oxoprolinase family protein [Microbulbifer sp. CAU 1566]